MHALPLELYHFGLVAGYHGTVILVVKVAPCLAATGQEMRVLSPSPCITDAPTRSQTRTNPLKYVKEKGQSEGHRSKKMAERINIPGPI